MTLGILIGVLVGAPLGFVASAMFSVNRKPGTRYTISTYRECRPYHLERGSRR